LKVVGIVTVDDIDHHCLCAVIFGYRRDFAVRPNVKSACFLISAFERSLM